MKRVILIFSVFHLCLTVFGQTYRNEWIDFSHPYYRLPVSTDGVYRISYLVLQQSGFPVQTTDPRQLQIFCNGVEQAIYVHGENDGIFHSTDYIEFYGSRNRTVLDYDLFKNPNDLANPDYSYISDTTSYFLTFASNFNTKRIATISDNNFSLYTPVPYVWTSVRQNYTGTYFPGATNSSGVSDFEYTEAEGWFDNPFSINTSTPNIPTTQSKSLQTPQVYTGGPTTTIDLSLIGASNYITTGPNHHVIIQFASVTIDTLFSGYKNIRINKNLPSSLFAGGYTDFTFTLPNDMGLGADRNTLAFIDIRYPRKLNLDNQAKLSFTVPVPTQTKALLQFSNINNPNSSLFLIYDRTNDKRVFAVQEGNNYKALLPSNGSAMECYATLESQIQNITQVIPVNKSSDNPGYFTNYSSAIYKDVNYVILTHSSLKTEAQEYLQYRASSGFKPLLVDVESLYEQFGYGIKKHPVAIRNFIRFGLTHFADTLKGLFIIGKGYRAGESTSSYRKYPAYFEQTLVPSFGNPPSDILFSSGIVDNLYMPAIPTGRISAKTPSDVLNYLNKVKDYEYAQKAPYNPNNPTEKEWMKKILHFAGGANVSQGQVLESYLNTYRDSLVQPFFGGTVKTYKKNSTDPIQQIITDSLKNKINNGVTMMTFFGHAAGIGFDISIDNPSEYQNYKKYFFVLANSCWAGDLFEPEPTSSESFVLIENKGAIGFLGSVTNAVASSLHNYSKTFTGQISNTNYGKSIGSSIKNTIQIIQSTGGSSIKEVCYSMTFHGDPVLILNSHPLPDYVLTPALIKIEPNTVTTEIDSFTVRINAKNIGKAIDSNIVIELKRIYPDNTIETYLKHIPAPYYSDTVLFTLPVNQIKGPGVNKLIATIDSYNTITEISELNNTATQQFIIGSSAVIPVYPIEFAVIPDTVVTLVASTSNPFMTSSNYSFEIDTTDTFNSPFKVSGVLANTSGGIIEWTIPFPMTSMPDSTVFFWRVGVSGSNEWRMSSFQFIPHQHGWGQSHFFQFEKDLYKNIIYNKTERLLQFDTTQVSISAQNGYYPYIQWNDSWVKINGIDQVGCMWSCASDVGHSMKFVIFNDFTADRWISYNQGDGLGTFGNLHCQTYPHSGLDYYTVRTDPTEQSAWHQKMVNLINSVPNGYYILAFSHRNHNAHNYPENLYQAFESFGSNYIRSISNNVPYMIFGRKGYPNTAMESVGSSITSVLKNDYHISVNINNGDIESAVIGPASSWSSLHWKTASAEPSAITDSSRLYVLGISSLGNTDTLIGPLPPVQDSLDIFNLSSRINASLYPYIKLVLRTYDDSLRTPSQIPYWYVLYDGIPETAICPNIYFSFYKDTLNEGEQVKLKIATKNVSGFDFPDSLMVSYWLVDRNNASTQLLLKKTEKHPSGHLLKDSISFSSKNFYGKNTLWVEFNPVNPATGNYAQLEQYHFNNIANIPFYVERDKANPLLDVTFDGIRIMNGDLVSSKPVIQILLKDENKFLLLNDTLNFRLFLQKPGSSELTRLFFVLGGEEKMHFYPATSSQNNTARIEYSAVFPDDGTYKLLVQAKDMSSNESGNYDYTISFQVINKSTITEVMNWPNPFSTKTHFVFTLTGATIPDYFKIQIMTITGKIVREIDLSELGSLHIGKNITQYAWDGKDQYGDQLANGIYLYRVITKIQNQNIEKNQTSASQYFVKDFGKMVLIR